jgi:hemerythrin
MSNRNQDLGTEHCLIGAHHEALTSYVNRLQVLRTNANPTREEFELLVQFVEFLEHYVQEHFKDEENCRLRHRCPAHKDAKVQHTVFLNFFGEFKRRFGVEGYRTELVRELFETCIALIDRHIQRTAAQLKSCRAAIREPGQTG